MRPDPRYELALASQVPHTQTEHPDTSAVAVTLPPEPRHGCENLPPLTITLALSEKHRVVKFFGNVDVSNNSA